MITDEDIKPYLEDYEKVTGDATKKFICPITLKECEISTLIDGHILNKSFNKASRHTIPQFGDIDGFYGTRVEESFVKFLNSKDHSISQIIAAAESLEVEFEDGTTAPCFPAIGASARHAKGSLPQWSTLIEDVEHSFFIKTSFDDKRITPRMKLIGKSRQFLPSHWTASMLKAGYLTVFDMIGYRAVFDPWGDTLRRTLKCYYTDNASREDAVNYFSDFKYATKLVGTGNAEDALLGNYQTFQFDSLKRNELLYHFTPLKNLFAVSCVFQINDLAAFVSLPSAMEGGDAETSWSYYTRLVNDEDPPQIVQPGEYKDGQFQLKQPIETHMLPDNEVRAILESQ